MKKYRIEGRIDWYSGSPSPSVPWPMINQTVNSYTDVLEGILGFVFGFLIIVGVWVAYTKIISEITVETEMDFRLNLALLMLVAIEPYLLYLLGHDDPGILDFGSTAYAVNIALIMLILAALYNRRPSEELSEEWRSRTGWTGTVSWRSRLSSWYRLFRSSGHRTRSLT